MTKLLDLLGKELLFFDGATGTMLQGLGLRPGELTESWNLTHPQLVYQVHKAYYDAGCNFVKSNTFGANQLKLAGSGLDQEQVIRAAVAIAKEAAAGRDKKYVALNIGPLGRLLAPYGDLPFEEAVANFAQLCRYGAAAGADCILIETMSDIYEAKAAILACKESCDLPIFITFTFDQGGKLLTGGSVAAAAILAESLGCAAVGFNCGLGPKQLAPLLPQMLEAVNLPIITNPNAGLPVEREGKTCFEVGPAEFAQLMQGLVAQGVSIAGGCCGTTPEHLRQEIALCRHLPAGGRRQHRHTTVTSHGQALFIGPQPLLIGERLNPTGKPRLKEALRQGDYDYVCRIGLEEVEQGAHILDVNVGLPGLDEAEVLAKAVCQLQAVTDVPLQIDTASPAAMERALRLYNGKPLLNSVSGKEESLAAVLPLAKKYGATVVALALDEEGIPSTAAGRIKVIDKILQRAAELGIEQRQLLVDPLALTISTGVENAAVACEVVAAMQARGLATILGISNISFGLPAREAVNAAFFAQALAAGLSCAIINPQSKAMLDAYYGYRALKGLDQGFKDYLAHYAAAEAPPSGGGGGAALSLRQAIEKGLAGASAAAAQAALATATPMELIDGELIPALEAVGRGFEARTLFLPQLLMSADAAKAAFEVLRRQGEGAAAPQGPLVLLATVEGDIHDIGKNIVKALLENYGYQVLDLGKDVPVGEVLAQAQRTKAQAVGLSALMTTTLGAMERTIAALHAATCCKVVVGGAVLTADYARRIGADAYAPNAVSAVRCVEEIFAQQRGGGEA